VILGQTKRLKRLSFSTPLTDSKSCRIYKLGAGGTWEAAALDGGSLEWGGPADAPDPIAAAGDWPAARAHYLEQGLTPGTATGFVRELRDFYTLGADTLWITFARDALWWAYAAPDVIIRDGSASGRAERYRRIIGQWRNSDINGLPLVMTGLSTRLTKVASYRQTMCSVEAEPYLLRRLNGLEEPAAAIARASRAALIDATAELVRQLHWADFELLIDLLFARTGWRRISTLGGTMKNNDLIIEQPATGERASVQVKSAADQSVLNACLEAFVASAISQRYFFVCHSPRGTLTLPAGIDRPVHLWDINTLAATAVANGMIDWLIERAA
jgi:hypothetical protein